MSKHVCILENNEITQVFVYQHIPVVGDTIVLWSKDRQTVFKRKIVKRIDKTYATIHLHVV